MLEQDCLSFLEKWKPVNLIKFILVQKRPGLKGFPFLRGGQQGGPLLPFLLFKCLLPSPPEDAHVCPSRHLLPEGIRPQAPAVHRPVLGEWP